MILPKWLLLSAIALQVAWCWNGFSNGGSDLDVLMRRKLDLLSSERRTRQAPQAHSRETDTSQYDLTLHRVKVNLNRTAADHQMLFTRVRSSGNLYLYSGKQISRVTVAETEVKLVPIAATSDIHEEVSEFQIEELKAIDNKTTLIVTVSLPDRMHVYQISDNSKGKVLTVKAMQRIKRPGQTHQSVLVQSKSNLFLISGYSEARFGKVVIYRWLDFHFSLRDVKEVDRCDKLLVFSGDQLVILVLEMAEYPERSVNNIFMLNDEFKLVKTQEMYFLFDRLPHYEVENQFYILRCLALDTCFLYRWNGESLFRRASKISYDPRNIDIMASGHGMIAMSLEGTLYFYDNQPLLKIAASYAIVNRRGTVTDKPFQLDPRVSDMFLYKEEATEKFYLCILYNSGAKLLDMVEIQLNKGRSAPSPGEQSNFNALKTCLFHMKDLANIRKKWIDLIKYQLSKTLRSCKSTGVLSLASKVFLAESNKVDRIEVDGNIENSPQDLLKEWSSTKNSLAEMHSQSQNLFYLNRMNTMQSNIKIQGNLRTKSTRMKHVKVHHPHSGRPAYVRPKRDLQSSRVITSAIVNAREVVYNGKMFAYTLSRNNVNYVSSPVHVANLHTQNVHIGLNTINRIPVDQMLYNATDKFVEKGHKVFKAIDTNTLKVYLVNGEKTTQQFSSLRNFVVTAGSEAPVKLSGARGVTNLIVGGKLNNVSLDDLLHQLYYVDKKSTINGNVFLRAPSYIRNVYARSLNSFPTSNIFDLRTNQTISAVVHLSQVYARNLYSKTINGINIPKDVALISSAKTIKAAVASNFVVKKDLTLSAEDQHFTKHVLGTKVEDFSQIYSGRVYLKGSLKLKQLNLENQKSQLVLNGFTASPDVQNHFWMKHVEQDIGTFTFNRNVKASHLVCAELNYNPTVSYLRGDHWPSHLNLEMSNAYVRGFIKTYATTPTFLQHISTEAVLRGSMSTVSGRKVFTGQLHTDTLVADGVDAINVQSLATDFSTMAFLDGVKEIEHFSSEECYIELLGGLTLQEYQNVSFNAIVESTVNTHNPQTLEYLFLPDIKVEHFRAALINGVNAEDFITEIDNFTYRVDPFAAQFKIDNLIVKKNVISTSQMFMDYLNTIAVKEYFKLLTLKGDSDQAQQWEIGGSKTLQKGMAVDGKLNVVHVNRLILDNILYNSARKTGPVNIAGLWNITQLAAKYLATKQINDLPIKHLQNSNLKSFKIKHDISVGTLTISANMHGHLFPNSSSVSMPPNIQMLASLTVHGSFLQEHWKPGTLLFDVMLSAVTGSTNVFDKKLVFRGHHVEIEKLRNEGKIFSKSCNFVNLLMDSVKRRQPNLVFSSLGKTFREVVCLGSVASNDLVTATLVNGIDVIHLNRSIHSVGHHQEMIKSTKFFEEEVKVVQLLCHDQLVDGIYPSNLDLYSDASQMVKKRYQFEKPISVIGNLYVDAINDFSLQHFLATRVVKNRTYTQEYHQEKSQQVTGLITFSNLVLFGEYNTVHVVNGIPVSEIVSRSSNEHQVMVETKHLTGTIQLIGPTSVMKCNNVSLLDAYKSSFKANSAEIAFKDLIFNSNGVLQNGLTIENKLNGVSVQKMMKLRLSSVEELLPLIPIIREQISVSNRAYLTNKPKDLHMLYIENIPLDERGTMVGKSEGQRTNEASDTVNFEKSCSNGMYRFNVTIRQKSSNGDISSARTVLDGVMIRSDWMEIANNGEIQTIVVSQVEKNAKYFLLLYVNRNGELSVQQELPLSSSAAVFYFVHVNDSALLLAVSDSHPLQLGHLAPKLKLFRYDPDVMRLVHFKTLSGHYNDVVAIDVEDVIMFAVSEQGSNMVEIFVLDRSYSALFQKLIFDSTLASMKAFKLQGSPVLQISAVDNLVYVYNYSILEGWRQLSYGRIPSDVN